MALTPARAGAIIMLETSLEPTDHRPVFLPSAEAAQARVPGFFEPTIQSSTVEARARSWTLLDPDMALAILVLMALSTLVWACGASFQWDTGPVVVCCGLMAGLLLFSTLRHLPTALAKPSVASVPLWANARATARDWTPLMILIWAFQSLQAYTEVVRKSSVEGALYQLDLNLFGLEPTVWVGHLFHPLLTDWMALAYSLYFAGPLILAGVLAWRGRREDFREMSSALVLQLGIGLFVCLCLPAGPPRLFGPLQSEFTPPCLHSFSGIYELQQRLFDLADPLRSRSSFPSLHCSLAVYTFSYARRFGGLVFPRMPRLFFTIFAPLAVSQCLATVYLRHHWGADIVMGLLLGYVTNAVARLLRTNSAFKPTAATKSRAAPTPTYATRATLEPSCSPCFAPFSKTVPCGGNCLATSGARKTCATD